MFRNAVLLLAPARDGLEVAQARVRDYLAWEKVMDDLVPKNEEEKKQKGSVDVARLQTLKINIDKAKAKMPEAIRQAYCIVVTVSDKDDVQAFKISVADEAHFETIKKDPRSRVQDTAITADALLPSGPYNLWKGGETSRRVKDLAGAFAQLPHLPKMLKSQAIVETLVEGCVQGTFVLKLTRPDRTFRTWWRTRPDDAALADPALELVLPEAAELGDIPGDLLAPKVLPNLWTGDQITAQAVLDYFSGTTVVQVDKGGFQEPVPVPKASADVVNAAIGEAVEAGKVWLLSGPASLLAEPIPAGVLTPHRRCASRPRRSACPRSCRQTCPEPGRTSETNALAIATALSQKAGKTLPWKTVKYVIEDSLQARFTQLAEGSAPWPCDSAGRTDGEDQSCPGRNRRWDRRWRHGQGERVGVELSRKSAWPQRDFEPSQIQDLGDLIPALLEIKAKSKVAMKFHVRLELGDGKTKPSDAVVSEVNAVTQRPG